MTSGAIGRDQNLWQITFQQMMVGGRVTLTTRRNAGTGGADGGFCNRWMERRVLMGSILTVVQPIWEEALVGQCRRGDR